MRAGGRQTGRMPCEDTEAQREDDHMTTQAENGAAAPELRVVGEGNKSNFGRT